MAAQKPAAAQPEPEPERPGAPLGSAGASSNPLVHQLLAERAIMTSAAADGEDASAALAAIDARLAGLGVSVDQ
jgi:hypothetical protein